MTGLLSMWETENSSATNHGIIGLPKPPPGVDKWHVTRDRLLRHVSIRPGLAGDTSQPPQMSAVPTSAAQGRHSRPRCCRSRSGRPGVQIVARPGRRPRRVPGRRRLHRASGRRRSRSMDRRRRRRRRTSAIGHSDRRPAPRGSAACWHGAGPRAPTARPGRAPPDRSGS